MAYDGGYTGEMVGFTGPGIPDITRVNNPRQPDTNNYLASNYFKLEVTRLPLVTYHCQNVNLPSVSISPTEQYSRAGTPIKWVGGRYTFEDLSVSFLVDEDMKNWIEVFEWMKSIGLMIDSKDTLNYKTPGRPSGQFEDYFSDAYLAITNSSYKPKIQVRIHEMFPTSLTGIQFNTTNSDNEPVIATATFAYTYYTIESLSSAQ